MKRILSCMLMLALFLSLGLMGVAYAGVPSDRVGVYEMVEITIDGEDYTEYMKEAGIVFTLELHEDGTALLDGGSEGSMSFKWDDSYFIYDSGEKSPYRFEDGVLTLEEDGTVMVFQRRGDAAGEPAAPAEAEELDITGTWVGMVDMRELVISSAEGLEELAPYLKTAPANVTVTMNGDGTYKLTVDGGPALDAMKDALRAYIKALCEENNLTEAQFEAAIGGSIDSFIDSAMAEVDLSDLVQSGSGKYVLEDGKVTWDPGANEMNGLFTGDFLTFTVEGMGDVALSREKLEGLWVCQVDVREDVIREIPELEEYLGETYMSVYLEMGEDGGYVLTADGSSMIPAFRDAMYRYIEASCEANNMSLEEFEAAAGMDVETLLDQATAAMDLDALSDKWEGKYTENGGKLVMDPGQSQTEGSYDGFVIAVELEDYGKLSFTRANFLGAWAGYADLSEFFTEGDEEMAQYVKDVNIGVTVELKADGSYTVELNGQPMLISLRSGMRAYLEHEAEVNGMTVEELEAKLGKSLDEYLDSVLEDIDTDALLTTEDGSYTVVNGRIVFDDSDSGLMDGVWSGRTLIFTLEDICDVVLTRR